MNSTPITELKGVGAKVASSLKRLKIETIGDLIYHFPRRYDDYSVIQNIADFKPGPVTAKVTIGSVSARYVRRGLHITEAILTDETGSVKAVWFNQPYRKNQLSKDKEYFVSGVYEFNNRTYSILNPSLEQVSDFPKNAARIVPIYPETKGLKSHTLRKLLLQIDFDRLDLDAAFPGERVMTHTEALHTLHFPKSSTQIEQARDHFAFEELFSVVLAAALVRKQNESFVAESTTFNLEKVKSFVDSLPFELTDDQRKAAWRCLQDMEKITPMNRLLEGDVGSGKTVVAALLAFNAAQSKQQTAIMVPTDVLARQHFKTMQQLLEERGVRCALYVGALPASEKKEIAGSIERGEVDVIMGTHALIQDGVAYKNLNLVVIDEQHRFGVQQRERLLKKSKKLPHVLTMSATPIPRTLALTVFGDLDISVIAQLPAGRKPIKTVLTSPNSIQRVYQRVVSEVAAGRQAFFVYPLIEESETLAAKNVTQSYEQLSKGPFKHLRCGLLHGKLKSEEKDAVMRAFAAHELDVLVSTTVIEVGVDVPNASVMVIEGAERFGLAQIHQLRGRVGRGEHESYCILVPTSSQQISQRLRALETITDGFRLAEYDLELRGPGAIYGSAQHGQLDLQFTDLSDPREIAKAKELAQDFVESGKELLEYPRLAGQVAQYKTITNLN